MCLCEKKIYFQIVHNSRSEFRGSSTWYQSCEQRSINTVFKMTSHTGLGLQEQDRLDGSSNFDIWKVNILFSVG